MCVRERIVVVNKLNSESFGKAFKTEFRPLRQNRLRKRKGTDKTYFFGALDLILFHTVRKSGKVV